MLNKKYLMNSKENFFSQNTAVPKENFNENWEKLIYQRKSIKDIEKKHKEWSKSLEDQIN
tara:strand:+ start:416 stop:595 length:180 start_codon:yes stop_codon:yes gene_type:complete